MAILPFRYADLAVRDTTYVIGIAVQSRRKVPPGFFVGKTVFRMSGKFPERNPTVKRRRNPGGIPRESRRDFLRFSRNPYVVRIYGKAGTENPRKAGKPFSPRLSCFQRKGFRLYYRHIRTRHGGNEICRERNGGYFRKITDMKNGKITDMKNGKIPEIKSRIF